MAGQGSAVRSTASKNWFLRIVATISTLAGWSAAAMIITAVAVTCQMIFVRFILNQSTIWQTEMVIYLVISATLVGLPYVQHLRGHVNVDLIPLMLAKRARFVLAIITLSVSAVMVAVMFWYGFEFWLLTWERGWRSDTIWGVRLWIPYLSLPVGFALFFLQLIADLVAVILKIETPFGLEEV
ncbi:TRAP dicarboxylate transporter, DctQ subunit, unknown substrate 4 [hydrothermal vent metagenome]|uniref:Tripartite ATP-independent periplasmic transporters DctQ component domain-containing protein n=1 Tax=hydrothermal vent metagenome TaxID=652676 RepID=A0A3B0U1B2_9ZZZZ